MIASTMVRASAKGLPLRPVGRGSMSAIIDHWASERTWNLDIWPVSQDGRYIFVRHALVPPNRRLRLGKGRRRRRLGIGSPGCFGAQAPRPPAGDARPDGVRSACARCSWVIDLGIWIRHGVACTAHETAPPTTLTRWRNPSALSGGGPRRPVARTTPGGFMTQTSTFDLPARHAAKAAPQRITRDDAHFATIAEALSADIADVEHNLETALSQQTGDAAGRVERDARVKHFQNRLKGLRSFQLDAVLGRMTPADGTDPVYVGRLAVHDQDGKPLLVDWRSPVAEPFFAATRADPMGLASRRRYRWGGGRIRDYWDETLS